MKEFKLSTASERVAGVCFSAAMIAVFMLLLFALRSQLILMIFCALGVLLIAFLLISYVRGVLRAVAIVDAENKQLQIKGVTDYTVDLKDAVLLQTVARKNGQSTVRLLVFSNENEEIVATVPTMFTFRQGIWADPMAKEMAAELGIAFQQNVPDWQLDKKKYEEHLKEEAEQAKREARERRQKKMAHRIQKRKKQLK